MRLAGDLTGENLEWRQSTFKREQGQPILLADLVYVEPMADEVI